MMVSPLGFEQPGIKSGMSTALPNKFRGLLPTNHAQHYKVFSEYGQ
jgi:hypothetical protein